jgi:intein/homing endonuclease
MRFRGVKYRQLAKHSIEEKTALAKLLGYLFGDGSISQNKDGRYECSISLALDEKEFVEDIKKITESLFQFAPKIKIENKNCFRILLRRSVARYLHHECRYPIGKKSAVNPHVPAWIMESESEVKASFIKGFLNAEASITDESIKIRQATRIFPPRDVINRLRQAARIRVASRYSYYSLSWRVGKSLCEPYIRPTS